MVREGFLEEAKYERGLEGLGGFLFIIKLFFLSFFFIIEE